MVRYVYDFAEGDKDKKDLLGGKGANLAEMIKIGLNVPPGFTVTTDACRAYLHGGAVPVEMADQVTEQLASLEAKIGRTLGDPANPLLVSVRSGAKFSMPGMMETVLNIGMSDDAVAGLTAFSERRAVRVGLLPPPDPDVRQDRAGHRGPLLRAGHRPGQDRRGRRHGRRAGRSRACRRWSPPTRTSSRSTPASTSRRTRASSSTARSRPCSTRGTPTAPSSTAARSASPPTWAPPSTCRRWCSATSVTTPAPAWRSPATPPPARTGLYGDYLPDAQGEDVVSGIRNTLTLDDMGRLDPEAHAQLLAIMDALEATTRTCATSSSPSSAASCGCCRPASGKRTAGAAFRIATPAGRRGRHRHGRGRCAA